MRVRMRMDESEDIVEDDDYSGRFCFCCRWGVQPDNGHRLKYWVSEKTGRP